MSEFSAYVKPAKVDIRRWLANLLSWDGLLPITLFVMAAVIKSLLINHPRLVEFSLIGMAVIAFFIRLKIGVTQLGSNQCGPKLRAVQFTVFILCMFLWALLEFILMLVPVKVWLASKADGFAWACLLSVYFAGMAFVWYPGRSQFEDHDSSEGSSSAPDISN